jgi:L,D-peptidoglycan transpeptidase YkuD (ErfK/YbiS/YcfS/YnhG family)
MISASGCSEGRRDFGRQDKVNDWTVTISGKGYRLTAPHHGCDCLIGKAGFIAGDDKREGDMATPVGIWPLRKVYYRPDRMAAPDTGLPVMSLSPDMGWCDDPGDPEYNRPVKLPHAARHEKLWREDGLYDLIVVLGHNDSPPVPWHGSAVFLHLREADTTHTAGCVAVTRQDLLELLRKADSGTVLHIGDDHRGEAAS